MYLNIILTILVVTLITMTIMVNRWWKKYGVEMFKTMNNLKNLNIGGSQINKAMFDLSKIMGGFK